MLVKIAGSGDPNVTVLAPTAVAWHMTPWTIASPDTLTVEFNALHNRIAYLEQQVRTLLEGQSTQTHDESMIDRVEDRSMKDLRNTTSSPQENAYIQLQGFEMLPWDYLDVTNDWTLELPLLPWGEDKISIVRSLLAKKGSQIQFDQESGKTVYVGPTSNHHLMDAPNAREGQLPSIPSTGNFVENSAFGAHEVQLFQTFKDKVHGMFPIISDDLCAQDSQLAEQAVSHPLLRYPILAVAAFFIDEELLTQWRTTRRLLIDNYSERFTTKVGPELENCCTQNVKAFLLKAYLDALRGSLESATIFNSIACAMAKRLGLHVDYTSDEVAPSIPPTPQREAFIFWATLWLDKYSFADDVSKDDATSDGHLKYITWFASLPASMKDVLNGKTFHPSFLSFHIAFHSGLILLHRRSFNDDGKAAELSNQRCEDSAAAITNLLKAYQEHFPHILADPLVLHAAFTSALVHLVLLLQPVFLVVSGNHRYEITATKKLNPQNKIIALDLIAANRNGLIMLVKNEPIPNPTMPTELPRALDLAGNISDGYVNGAHTELELVSK
ncbi:hypothetical protein BDW59DRAFT_160804 [Aspergillus cavernicola]|uniref:Xylanolytic transcriptional activator regulatory domain-containing protein n=1 Tax=Aspergillus cavernicola TaxID=176166 RepID=A0ABR4IFX7_9EURO